MNLLTPPTDSLYKFIAISGLTAMIGGLILFFTSIDNAEELAVKYQGEERILKKEIKLIIGELEYNKRYKGLSDSISKDIDRLLGRDDNSFSLNDSIYKEILFNLPDSIKNEFKKIILKKEELENNKDLTEYHKSTSESYQVPYLILLYGGELFAMLGFLFWWDKVQKPYNKTQYNKVLAETNKLLAIDLWQKNCQSCLKTIRLMDERGTEINGKHNKTYCLNCYRNGRFVEPELAFDIASKRLETECKNRKYGKLKISSQLKSLKTCIRWESNANW